MEIKRRLNAAAKKITPAIEASNTGIEMANVLNRFEELLNYAEEKDTRRIESEKTGKSLGVRQAEAAQAIRDEQDKVQEKAHNEFVSDQQQQNAQPDADKEVVSAR